MLKGQPEGWRDKFVFCCARQSATRHGGPAGQRFGPNKKTRTGQCS
jgi:hypothetical protein